MDNSLTKNEMNMILDYLSSGIDDCKEAIIEASKRGDTDGVIEFADYLKITQSCKNKIINMRNKN